MQPRQLPDGLLEARIRGQAEAHLFLVEVATYPERRLVEQVLGDSALAWLNRRVLPKLYASGWTDEQINEQQTFTDGRIVPGTKKIRRLKQKRADYRLRYTRDFPIAIVEAKPSYKTAGEGLQQAKDYAQILDLKFAYTTNGHEIIEFDFLTGLERFVDTFPSPDELWQHFRAGAGLADDKIAEQLLTPYFSPGFHRRYYQETAINRAVQAIL